jgi:hypothetical protein
MMSATAAINYRYDTVTEGKGRLASVTLDGSKAGEPNRTYASAMSYAPHGGLAQLTYGNGLLEHTTFNSRLQPTRITLSSQPFSLSTILDGA